MAQRPHETHAAPKPRVAEGNPLEARVQSLEVRLEALLEHPHIVSLIGSKAAAAAGVQPAPAPEPPAGDEPAPPPSVP